MVVGYFQFQGPVFTVNIVVFPVFSQQWFPVFSGNSSSYGNENGILCGI